MSARVLLNTLYVQTQGGYLRLDHDTVLLDIERETVAQIPLHHLCGIAVFGNVLVSPYLLARCARDGRALTWFSTSGRFNGRLAAPTSGNVLLRKAQFECAADPARTERLAAEFVSGKLLATISVLGRGFRDYSDDDLDRARSQIRRLRSKLPAQEDIARIRGIEGRAARVYFAAFPKLLRANDFCFTGRTKRPPRDPVNAALSFTYALLGNDCAAALEGVGLDPQVGFLHAIRPGRPSLALDLMEEFRSAFADRLVLTLLNRQQLQGADFDHRPGGAVLLNDRGRKTLLTAYESRKQEEIGHRLFKEQIPVGLLLHVQARVLARCIRGEIDSYTPYRWR